jgi:hypothetical protein
MKKTTITAAAVLACSLPVFSAITVQAHFEMGDNGVGIDNLPQDSSGNGRHFTGTNGVGTTVILTGGGYNNDAYYSFNGEQGFNDIGYTAPQDNVGIELWVRTQNTTQNNVTIFSTGDASQGLALGRDSTGWWGSHALVSYVPATNNFVGGDASEWIHLAIVRDNGVTTFYTNGVAVGDPVMAGVNTNTNVHLGNPPLSGGGGFDGDIAQARIFTFTAGQFSTSDLLFPAIPEPSAALLGGLGLLSLLRRRR